LNLTDSSCILFYNPYSIVKELPIAKIGAELISSIALTADSRGHILLRRGLVDNLMGTDTIPAQPGASHGAGGADRDRTDDPLLAKQVLSQLSYSPVRSGFGGMLNGEC
jgi:hypothetical protein